MPHIEAYFIREKTLNRFIEMHTFLNDYFITYIFITTYVLYKHVFFYPSLERSL